MLTPKHTMQGIALPDKYIKIVLQNNGLDTFATI